MELYRRECAMTDDLARRLEAEQLRDEEVAGRGRQSSAESAALAAGRPRPNPYRGRVSGLNYQLSPRSAAIVNLKTMLRLLA